MQEYKPSNKVASIGWLYLILATLVGGAAIGALAYFASKLVYLIILFPLVMGFLGGMTLYGAIKVGKVRSPALAIVFGVLITVVIYGAYLFGEYLSLKADYSNLTFFDFLRLASEVGVKIGRFSSSAGITFSGIGYWIYVLVEMGIIGFLACSTAYGAAKTPFCESSQEWMDDEKVIGGVNIANASQFKFLLTSGQIEPARAMLMPQAQHHGDLIIKAATCPDCGNCDVAIKVKQVQTDKKNKVTTKDYFAGMLPQAAFQQLTRPYAPPPPQQQYNAPAQNY